MISKYYSIREAYRETKIHFGRISEVCRGIEKSTGGYRWTLKGELPKKYNIITNEVIEEYESIEIAAKLNKINSSSHISQCCRGKRKSAGGHNWRYA